MRDYKQWKASEVKILKMGLIPEGRTILACRLFCCRHKIKFPGIFEINNNKRLLEKH